MTHEERAFFSIIGAEAQPKIWREPSKAGYWLVDCLRRVRWSKIEQQLNGSPAAQTNSARLFPQQIEASNGEHNAHEPLPRRRFVKKENPGKRHDRCAPR